MSQPTSLTAGPAVFTSFPTRFDPRDTLFLQHPYPVYAAFRESAPVYVPPAVDGSVPPAWIFTHRAAASLLTDSRIQRQPLRNEVEAGHRSTSSSAYARMIGNWMLFQDAPSHTRQRASLGRIFTPPVVNAMRSEIERIVNTRIDSLIDRGSGDLIADFAFPLPVQVIASLLGLPENDCDLFKRWSTAISDAIDVCPSDEVMQLAENAAVEARSYFACCVESRRQSRSNDLLSTLVAQVNKNDGLTEDEAFATFTLLVTAGHETTTNLVGNGMLALLSNPGELEHLRSHPECIRTAVEECLRYESPVQITSRIVSAPLEIEGEQLEPGQRVLIVIGSANRDPAVFAAPDTFDIRRSPNPQLTFGLGSHYCAGSPLARLQASIAIMALINRLPGLRVASNTLEWRTNAAFRGLVRFPVAF